VDIEVAAIRERRKGERQHAHLDLTADIQLALHPVLGRSCASEIVERLLQLEVFCLDLRHQLVAALLLDNRAQLIDETLGRTAGSGQLHHPANTRFAGFVRHIAKLVEEVRDSPEFLLRHTAKKIETETWHLPIVVDTDLNSRRDTGVEDQATELGGRCGETGRSDRVLEDRLRDSANLVACLADR
jgi:hypothetical protein